MSRHDVLVLDGPLGTALEDLGLALPAPLWTALAVRDRPERVAEVHAAYARAGADVHTTGTFRTTARALASAARQAGVPEDGNAWRALVSRAVTLCRDAARAGSSDASGIAAPGERHPRVAGSMAPLEDCYRPDLTPDDETLVREHGALARALVEDGVDLLLVETMPTRRELAAATRAAASTGVPVWAAVTLGPRSDFFDDETLVAAAEDAAEAGAEAFLVNCSAPLATTRALELVAARANRPPRLGAYANAIYEGDSDWPPLRYAAQAERWIELGATLIGGCCGTDARHLRALRRLVDGARPRGPEEQAP
ncbi:MAG: homocysteine S-methyltransferase family protein [Planctomycetes bacterium]|nr:homocysteine S-methyltransferase family protein [Planctomycetota bacterium]